MKRILIYLIEIILCFVIQTSTFHYFGLGDIMPNLLLILVVSHGYMSGKITGLAIGFFSGLLVDLVYGDLIGLNALLYMVIGYFIGYSNKIYANDDYTFPIIFVAISDLVYNFFYYIFEFLLRGRLNLLYYLRRIVLSEIIYTVVASIFVYKFLHMINNLLKRKANEEE